MTWRIQAGDARAVLAGWPAGSVQCCVSSPPYWGLRAYGTTPQVWGGRDDCAHEWGSLLPHPNATKHANPASYGKQAHLPAEHSQRTIGAYCAACGAWRGELGSEPTVEQYCANMVQVFRAVRRVLRPDGTLFINIGDSYSNAGRAGSRGIRNGTNEGGKPTWTAARATPRRYRLRADLTEQEQAYVLQELAAARLVRKPRLPEIAAGVDEAIAPLTSGE